MRHVYTCIHVHDLMCVIVDVELVAKRYIVHVVKKYVLPYSFVDYNILIILHRLDSTSQ